MHIGFYSKASEKVACKDPTTGCHISTLVQMFNTGLRKVRESFSLIPSVLRPARHRDGSRSSHLLRLGPVGPSPPGHGPTRPDCRLRQQELRARERARKAIIVRAGGVPCRNSMLRQSCDLRIQLSSRHPTPGTRLRASDGTRSQTPGIRPRCPARQTCKHRTHGAAQDQPSTMQ